MRVGAERVDTVEPVQVRPVLLRRELLLVIALSYGASGVSAFISLIADLTRPAKLSSQQALLNVSQAPGRPWLDLSWQLFGIATALVPVVLVAHLLHRKEASGAEESLADLGLDRTQPRLDAARGVVIAAVIGGAGLGLYLAAHALNLAVTVVPASLPAVWWRYPVLVLSAVQNAIGEEVIVLGYVIRRLHQLGWSPRKAGAASALLRGSYHLYQGFGAFVGNAVMGVVFAWLYRRWGRITPMLIAHALIDSTTFVGYTLLAGHVSWLPH